MVRENEALTKQLVDNLSKHVEQPPLPETTQVIKHSRRYSKTRMSVDENDGNPFVRIGKNLPKYGSLLKSLVVKEINDENDAIPVIEEKDPTVSI